MKRRIVLLGPPASGKGTLAERIRQAWQLPATSTGAILRRELRQGGSLADAARPFVEKGALVPDALILDLIKEWLDRHGFERFLFDGFPRTEPQAEQFDALLARQERPLEAVILVDTPESVIRTRILRRLTCPGCGAVWREATGLPGPGAPCPSCATPLERRADDTEVALDRRLADYHALTAPLIRRYREAGILSSVAGDGHPDAVFDRVREIVEAP